MVEYDKVRPLLDKLKEVQGELAELGVLVTVTIDYSTVLESEEDVEAYADRLVNDMNDESETMN